MRRNRPQPQPPPYCAPPGEMSETWDRLPNEMCVKIIKQLDPISKIRLGRCLKRFHALASSCKHRVDSIAWKTDKESTRIVFKFEESDEAFIIRIKFNQDESLDWFGYSDAGDVLNSMWFPLCYDTEKNNRNKSEVSFSSYDSKKKKTTQCWKNLKNETRLDFGVEYLNSLLTEHDETVKMLTIEGYYPFENFKLHIPSSLETLKLIAKADHKSFNLDSHQAFQDICPIQTVQLTGTNISLEQLLQFKSSSITISNIGLSINDVKQYLTMWREGQLHENMTKLIVVGVYDEEYHKMLESLDFTKNDKVSNTNGWSRRFELKTSVKHWIIVFTVQHGARPRPGTSRASNVARRSAMWIQILRKETTE